MITNRCPLKVGLICTTLGVKSNAGGQGKLMMKLVMSILGKIKKDKTQSI